MHKLNVSSKMLQNLGKVVLAEGNQNHLISSGSKMFKKSSFSLQKLKKKTAPTSIHSPPWILSKLLLPCYHRNFTTFCTLNSSKNSWFTPKGYVSSSSFLQSHPAYKHLVFSLEDSNPTQVTHPEVQRFISLSNSNPDAPICGPKFDQEITKLLSSLEAFTDEELLQVLYNFNNFPRPSSPNLESYKGIWKKLDEECLRRAIHRQEWRSPIHFVMTDLWYKLGLAHNSNFHWQFVKQCLRKVDKLSREQLVRLCFSLSMTSSLPPAIKLYNLQFNFSRILEQENPRLTSEEIAIICLAFYKNKSPLYETSVVRKVLEFVSQDVDTISSGSLNTITKTLNLGTHRELDQQIYNFLTLFINKLNRLDISACASLANIGTRERVRNEEFLQSLVLRVQWSLDKARLKDLQLIAFALTLFNIKCEPVLEEIVQVLRAIRNDQMAQNECASTNLNSFNRCLPKILNSLACQNIYPQDLISYVFSKEFLNSVYGSRMYFCKQELIILDSNVHADLKDYKENSLNPKARGYLSKKFMTWMDPPEKLKTTPYKQMCRSVQSLLIDIFGGDSSFIHLCNILPHHNSIEAVFCTNESGELQRVPQVYKEKVESEAKSLTNEDLKCKLEYHVILIYFWDHLIFNSDESIGPLQLGIRQIQTMGYKTYVLGYWSWKNCTTLEEQKNYIRNLIGNSFKNPSTTQALVDKRINKN